MPLTPDKLTLWRNDASWCNSWRYESGIDEDYHDGNQYDAETARKMEERGLPLTVVNLSRDLVQTVVGLQERNQSDWIVRVDSSEDYRDLAEMLSLKLKEAERMTKADRACLDAAESQYKAGIGWVEVGRSDSLLEYPYNVLNIDWREIWWDVRAKSADIVTDAQYMRRLRFFEKGEIRTKFPASVSQIEMAGRGSDYAVGWYEPEQFLRDSAMRDMTRVSVDLWGANRNLVGIEELYYRTQEQGYAVQLPSGRWTAFDQNNPAHMRAYESGIVLPKPTWIQKMNRAVVCGNAILLDGPSPYPHNEFPWTPFIYAREARTGSPYGVLRVVRSLQDEINTRRARMMWSLNAKRVVYDADAVTDPESLREEVGRADAMIELNPSRRPTSKIDIQNDNGLNAQQWQVYEQAIGLMPQLAGVPRSLSGQKETGVNSGVAINSLVDQGVNSQSKPTALYRESRRRVGGQLLALIVQDMGDRMQELTAERRDGTTAKVTVNQPTQHPDGYSYLENPVQQVRLVTVLDDVPSTPTFRNQQFQEISRALQTMPPQVQAVALPFLVEASEMPNKNDMARLLRKQMGIGGEMTPEEQAQFQQEQQIKQLQEQIALAMAKAELSIKQGEAAQKVAMAQKTAAETAQTVAKTEEIRQDMAAHDQMLSQGGAAPKETVVYHW